MIILKTIKNQCYSPDDIFLNAYLVACWYSTTDCTISDKSSEQLRVWLMLVLVVSQTSAWLCEDQTRALGTKERQDGFRSLWSKKSRLKYRTVSDSMLIAVAGGLYQKKPTSWSKLLGLIVLRDTHMIRDIWYDIEKLYLGQILHKNSSEHVGTVNAIISE